jgi:Fe-S oxidoreductase
MAISSLLFVVILIATHAYAATRFYELYKLASATTGTPWSGNRLDRIQERIATTIYNVLGQAAVLRKNPIGIAHTLIFWGFIIITVGTMELFVREIFPTASFEFIGEAPYGALVFLQDSFIVLVLVGVSYALYRRIFVKPAGLGKSADAMIILSLTTSLMLSLLAMNGFRMLAEPEWFDHWMWASTLVARGLEAFHFTSQTNGFLSSFFRWVHHLLVLGFLCYIPNSKHLHVIAAGPNTFLRKLDLTKGMKPLNLEDENATSFGVTKVSDLSWKDVLDGYACTECGRCQDECPAYNTEKPLSPKKLIIDLKHSLHDNAQALKLGKLDEVKPVLGTEITDDVIWSCTSCRACEEACPVFIEHTDKIYDIRRSMVLMESRFPPELQTVFKNMESNFSPWAMSPEERANWAEGLNVKTMNQLSQSNETVEYLFWVGCAGSFDDRNKKVSRALVNLLNRAGIKYAILGNEEKCTGDPARRAGNEYLAQMLIKENVETLKRYAVKKVVTACPHCFNAIKNEWTQFDGQFEVIHHTQLLAELVKNGSLKPNKAMNESITYHDSCYLGRWNGEYSAPREILKTIPEIKLTEMAKNSNKAMCCGAGGGRMWMEEHIGRRVNITRTEQALETGAKVVAANCPFCMTMITDGVKAKEKVDQVVVKDIAEILDQSVS